MNKICRHGKKLRNVKRHFHWEEGGLSLAHPLTKPLANMAWLRRLLFLDSLMMDLTFLGRNFSKRDLNQGCLSLLPPPLTTASRRQLPPPQPTGSRRRQPAKDQTFFRQPHTWLIVWEIAVLDDVVLFCRNQILSYFLGSASPNWTGQPHNNAIVVQFSITI